MPVHPDLMLRTIKRPPSAFPRCFRSQTVPAAVAMDFLFYAAFPKAFHSPTRPAASLNKAGGFVLGFCTVSVNAVPEHFANFCWIPHGDAWPSWERVVAEEQVGYRCESLIFPATDSCWQSAFGWGLFLLKVPLPYFRKYWCLIEWAAECISLSIKKGKIQLFFF